MIIQSETSHFWHFDAHFKMKFQANMTLLEEEELTMEELSVEENQQMLIEGKTL